MANQEETGNSKKSCLISYQCLYEQLSEDWRSRDRITWQLPSVLVVVGGLLLIGIFGGLGEISVDPVVRKWLLKGGLVFASLFTIMLTRNLYHQAVSHDLMDKIQEGKAHKAIVGAGRIPKRRKEYKFPNMIADIILKPISSALLLLFLCPSIVGLFSFLLENFPCQNQGKYYYGWFIGGGVISFLGIFLILFISWRWLPGYAQCVSQEEVTT